MRVKSTLIRQKILEIAGELFVSQGFGAVSMSQIAATLGGSKSTLYNHFRSKEELFEAYVIEAGRERFAALSEINPAFGEAQAVLVSFGRAYLSLLLSPSVLAVNRLVIAETTRFPALGHIFYENGPRQTLDRIVMVMKVLAARALIEAGDMRLAGLVFKAMAEADLYEKHLWGLIGEAEQATIEAAAVKASDEFLLHYGVRTSRSEWPFGAAAPRT
jgi:TetR/AcrR family transcriptional repressor of mexJK operon